MTSLAIITADSLAAMLATVTADTLAGKRDGTLILLPKQAEDGLCTHQGFGVVGFVGA